MIGRLRCWLARSGVALAALGLCACEPDPLPPDAEALVVVDTDLPVPHVVSRLRVDFYAEDGTWFESRDIARPDPRDWPASFSVYSDDDSRPRLAWVRLRGYPEGRVRDYLGERFGDWGGPLEEPEPTSLAPRLLRDGVDVTPPTEPEPLVTVDRLLLLQLNPGERGRVMVTLHGGCAGTMALLDPAPPHERPVVGQAASCVDLDKQRQIVEPARLDDDMSRPSESVQGTWGAQPCTSTDPERICIPGGATILGSGELTFQTGLSALPERIVRHSSFLLDRTEITVGRFRQTLAAGFVPPLMPVANEGELGTDVHSSCTWSGTDRGREHYALTCVSWHLARAFCQFEGGDLPTEAGWEYASTGASGTGRTRYSWGDLPPSCERAIYGRLPLGGTPGVCEHLGPGVHPVDAAQAEDRTSQGVVGLAGTAAEWMLDAYASYRSACWGDASLTDPRCWQDDPAERALRGGSWASPPTFLPAAVRAGADPTGEASFIGFRCAYPPPEAR